MNIRLTALAFAGIILAGCANVQALKPTEFNLVPESQFTPYPTPSQLVIIPLDRNIHVDPTLAPTPRPTPKPVIIKQPPKPIVPHNRSINGSATWYCLPGISGCMKAHPTGGYYAAAGPSLRAAIGSGWRGTRLEVCNLAGKCIDNVILADWCACGDNHPIDLYSDVFRQLGPLSAGRIKVIIKW